MRLAPILLPAICFAVSSPLYNDLYDAATYQKISSCLSKHTTIKIDHRQLQNECAALIDHHVEMRCSDSDFEIVKILEHQHSHRYTNRGYLAVDHAKKRLVLAFCGSKTWIDWILDVSFSKTVFHPENSHSASTAIHRKHCGRNQCRIHLGFHTSIKSLFPSFHSEVDRLLDQYPDYKIWVTGHSLGGAMALLAGIELRMSGHKPLVFTAGGPRVGNVEMASYVDELFKVDELHQSMESEYTQFRDRNGVLIRLTHTGDAVPQAPPESLGYHHSGVELHIVKGELPHLALDIGFSYHAGPDEESGDVDDAHFYQDEPWDFDMVMSLINASVSLVPNFKRGAHARYLKMVTSCTNDD